MTTTSSRLLRALPFAGTLPFVAVALVKIAGIESVPYLPSMSSTVSSYGLVITCFMAGTHWGIATNEHERSPISLFGTSNAITLFVWFAYLSASTSIALACQIVAFLALLVIDHRLLARNMISKDYYIIRRTVTLIVVLSLITFLAA